MSNYDFNILSPFEFEELSRDVLQEEHGVLFESFTNGRDSGIDFRHTRAGNWIVQAKRYKTYAQLRTELKKEAAKAKKLHPGRYTLLTSVGLTPKNKDEIIKIYKGLIVSTDDIYGANDINNRLGVFPAVEKRHPKLWLSSSAVLDHILHSIVINQSEFEKATIEEEVEKYVENKSFFEALQILTKHNFCIISGAPGVGKTTLARMLIYHYLSTGFKEFVYISDSIAQGYQTYKDKMKQVFLFDDFLGRNFLEKNLSTNEETQIVKFIQRIAKSKNKILICTTREYILNQAKAKYDLLEENTSGDGSYILDIGKYTKLIKAKILYNHLFFSTIPQEYINELAATKDYLKIIQHQNYTPRRIESLTKENFWKKYTSQQYPQKVLEALDDPEAIWGHPYEHQITKLARCILGILVTTGTPIFEEDLRSATEEFCKVNKDKYGIAADNFEYINALKELENTFITITKEERNILIEFQNPSIQDYMIKFLAQREDLLVDILNAAHFINQLYSIISNKKKNTYGLQKINPQEKVYAAIKDKLFRSFKELKHSRIISVRTTRGEYYKRREWRGPVEMLESIINNFTIDQDKQLREWLITEFNHITVSNLNNIEQYAYIELLTKLKNYTKFDDKRVIQELFTQCRTITEIHTFLKLKEIFPKEYEKFIKDEDVLNVIHKRIRRDVQDPGEFADTMIDELENIAHELEINLDREIDDVKSFLFGDEEETEEKEPEYIPTNEKEDVPNSVIIKMFESIQK
jgi:DNA polymerase III delta prime subunit